MAKPGRQIKRVIKKFAVKREIKSNSQEDGFYNDEGDFVRGDRSVNYIQIETQPLSGKEALNLPENLRTKEVLNYWTIENEKVDLKKQIIIDDKIYSIETMKTYSSHTEGMLTRSGKTNHRTV